MAVDVKVAETPAERERVFRFRYEVHVEELGKTGPGVDPERRMIVDEADEDAEIAYAEDESGRIIGTCRTRTGARTPLPEGLRVAFNTAPVEAAHGATSVSVTGRFMVDPAYRGRTVASLLLFQQFARVRELGIQFNYCYCEPSLVRLYRRLGYRPYREAVRPDGTQLRVPLVLNLRDGSILRSRQSPFAILVDEAWDDAGAGTRTLEQVYCLPPAADDVACGDLRTLWAEIADGTSRTGRPSVFDGVPTDAVERLFARGALLRFRRGERVRLSDERQGELAIVRTGRVGVGVPVDDGHHWLELLHAGDVYGELGGAGPARRASELVALAETEVVVLPADLLERLDSAERGLAMTVARNLLRIMAWRVDDLHRRHAFGVRRDRDRLARERTVPPGIHAA